MVTLYSYRDKEFHEIKFASSLTEEHITGGHGGGDIYNITKKICYGRKLFKNKTIALLLT